jgi:hypothetical protein
MSVGPSRANRRRCVTLPSRRRGHFIINLGRVYYLLFMNLTLTAFAITSALVVIGALVLYFVLREP